MNTKFEQKKIVEGFQVVMGCDEVGRGCLAGPVVAAAVSFDFTSNNLDKKVSKLINDSKILSPKRRAELDVFIRNNSLSYGIGVVGVKEIEKINIHHASLKAMRLAVESLLTKMKDVLVSSETISLKKTGARKQGGYEKQSFLFVDGKFVIKDLDGVSQESVIDGDAKVFSIAAASIVAKVYRDTLMAAMDKKYPGYDFWKHKGYGTLHHVSALKKIGLSPLHRLSFCSKYV